MPSVIFMHLCKYNASFLTSPNTVQAKFTTIKQNQYNT